MMKNWEIDGTEEIGLVTPTPGALQATGHRDNGGTVNWPR